MSRLLIPGGSGHVGSLVVSWLAGYGHAITIFDRRAPGFPVPEGVRFVEGDVTDPAGVRAAMAGQEAVLYLAMGAMPRGASRDTVVASAFDVNAKGVWVCAEAAREAGAARFVYASSLSIYEATMTRPLASEDEPADALGLYGMTKGFGETALRRFAVGENEKRLSAFALRLCLPVESRERADELIAEGKDCPLTADETARAFHAALTVPHEGFTPLFIVGGAARGRVDLTRAKRILDWEPDPVTESGGTEPGLTKVAEGLVFAEGPAYDGKGAVIVSNCYGGALTRIDRAGSVSTYLTAAADPASPDAPFTFQKPNGATFYRDGSLFVCDFGWNAIVRIFPSGEQEIYVRDCDGVPFRGPNDLAFDPQGNLYFTDPAGSSRNNPIGCVYRVERGTRRVTRVAEGLAFPNGLAFAADGQSLYLCESQKNHVLRCRVAPDGSLTGMTIAADCSVNGPGSPDGMAVDQDGNLVVAHFGGGAALVFDSEGRLTRKIPLPGKQVTNVEFAGRDLRTLFITEAETNAVYRLRVETPGLPLFCAPENTGAYRVS